MAGPLTPLLPLIIGGAVQLGQGIYNNVQQRKQNRRSEAFARETQHRQYLQEQSLWRQQNEYNTPSAQMARFKNAGLNPNLIYGQGNSGNASAMSAPASQRPEFIAPQMDFNAIGLLSQYADLKLKDAQTNNLTEQNTVIKQEALLKEAQTRATMTDAERKIFDLTMEKGLADTTAEYRREQLREKTTAIDISIQRNEREAAMNASNLREAAQRIINMRVQARSQMLQNTKVPAERAKLVQEIKNLKAAEQNTYKDSALKNLELDLNKQGIQKSDPIWLRALGTYINEITGENPSKALTNPLSTYGDWIGKRLKRK